jgi:hypothetical protein
MNSARLKKLAWSAYKMADRLKKEGARDAELVALHKLAEDLQRAMWRLAQSRELVEAERKDKGAVVWELFFPRRGFFGGGRLKRTPNRMLDTTYATLDEAVYVRRPEEADKELDQAWHREPFDLVKFREHATKVDRHWAAFQEKEAA